MGAVFFFCRYVFRPFGFEVNLDSPDRESPERGRMLQHLMKAEHDLGAMVSFEPRRKSSPLRNLKPDIGFLMARGEVPLLTMIHTADIMYRSLCLGYISYKNEHVKLSL